MLMPPFSVGHRCKIIFAVTQKVSYSISHDTVLNQNCFIAGMESFDAEYRERAGSL